MDPEQSQADSDQSVMDRLANVLSSEAEKPETQTAEPVVESPTGEQSNDENEVSAEPEFVDFEDDDGTVYQIPAALKDKIPLRADYTRKTQQAAALAEQANDRLQYAEAREQFMASVMNEVAEVQALKAQLKQYDAFDPSTLYASDPGTAMRIRDQREDLRRQIQEKEQAIGGKARSLEEMQNAHNSKQWELAVDGVKKRLGTISKETDVAMERRAQELGFTAKELRGRYADPRILELIHDSAVLKQINSGKTNALETVRKAPPILKPGASNPGSATVNKYVDLRKSLKRSGSVEDAARLFKIRGMK